MIKQELNNFHRLKELNKQNIINIQIFTIKKLYQTLSNPNLINIKQSPLGFFQLEIIKNNFGKVKIHYYPLSVNDIFPHYHGGDIRSIILKGQITQYKYLYQEINPENYPQIILLEEIIARSIGNSINTKKIKNEFEKQFHKSSKNILEIDEVIKNMLLNIFSKKDIQRFSVKYNITKNRGIIHPEGLYFINEYKKEVFKKGDNYFLGKEEIHKVKIQKDSITLFMIEKNPISKNGKAYNAGPFKTIDQEKEDKVELTSKVLNYEEKKKIIEKIIKLLD